MSIRSDEEYCDSDYTKENQRLRDEVNRLALKETASQNDIASLENKVGNRDKVIHSISQSLSSCNKANEELQDKFDSQAKALNRVTLENIDLRNDIASYANDTAMELVKRPEIKKLVSSLMNEEINKLKSLALTHLNTADMYKAQVLKADEEFIKQGNVIDEINNRIFNISEIIKFSRK